MVTLGVGLILMELANKLDWLTGGADGLQGVVMLSLIHISEPTRLLSISYDVFCLKKKTQVEPGDFTSDLPNRMSALYAQ